MALFNQMEDTTKGVVSMATQAELRNAARLFRMKLAVNKTLDKLEVLDPESDLAKIYQKKLKEYSLDIAESQLLNVYNQEKRKIGVNIQVPTHKFDMEAKPIEKGS